MDMSDEVSKAKLGEAYWLPIPLSYIRAVGAVALQWGSVEMHFVGLIRFLARHPDASDMVKTIPGSFNDKAKLLKALVRRLFPQHPSLVEKLCGYASRANALAKKRNAIVHGFWYDLEHFDPKLGVTLATKPDGTGDFYSVKLEQMEVTCSPISRRS